MTSLAGKRAFITGATSGIGLAIARRFAADGASLVVNARREEALASTAKDLRERGAREVTALAFDVADGEGLALAERTHPSAFKDVDVLVNNAGLARGTDTLQEGSPAEWDEVIDTNVKGLLRVSRAVLPHMLARGRGHVVNMGSTAGHWVYKGGAVYCASKHAVAAISEAMRLDVHGSGIRVTEIDPGLVETNFSVVRFRGDVARAKSVYEGYTPLSPEDVADSVHYAVTRPAHVNIQQMILMPVDQASVRDVHKRPA